MLLYTDFTIPPHLRQNFTNPKQWKALRDKVWTLLAKHFGALFGIEATHPISEKHPNKFHPHLNFLWVQKRGFKPFIDLELLKKEFSNLLDYRGKAVLDHSYSSATHKIIHWCSYVTRVFPEYAVWTGQLRWFGHYPRYKKLSNNICSTCGTQLFTVGWLDHYQVESYYTFGINHGLSPPWDDITKINLFQRTECKKTKTA